jgi:hypothetical protein
MLLIRLFTNFINKGLFIQFFLLHKIFLIAHHYIIKLNYLYFVQLIKLIDYKIGNEIFSDSLHNKLFLKKFII